jgi:hypothetical protein
MTRTTTVSRRGNRNGEQIDAPWRHRGRLLIVEGLKADVCAGLRASCSRGGRCSGCLQSRSLVVHDHGFFISGPAVVEILDENQRMCMDSDFSQWGLSPANGTINRRGSRSTLSSVSFSKTSHWKGCPQRKSFFSTRSGRSFTRSAAFRIFWW